MTTTNDHLIRAAASQVKDVFKLYAEQVATVSESMRLIQDLIDTHNDNWPEYELKTICVSDARLQEIANDNWRKWINEAKLKP